MRSRTLTTWGTTVESYPANIISSGVAIDKLWASRNYLQWFRKTFPVSKQVRKVHYPKHFFFKPFSIEWFEKIMQNSNQKKETIILNGYLKILSNSRPSLESSSSWTLRIDLTNTATGMKMTLSSHAE